MPSASEPPPIDDLAVQPIVALHLPSGSERLGDRIGRLRTALGLTQTELAGRVAISRVALSNLESGRSMPGERTVTLLAGMFHLEPHELVAGTEYPASKADRLPLVAARHTELDLQLALLDRDLRWLEGAPRGVSSRVSAEWRERLAGLDVLALSARERSALESARRRIAEAG